MESISVKSWESDSCGDVSAIVITDRLGFIQWANADFVKLCGFTLEEIVGKKPGEFLQGPLTDANAVQQLSKAIRMGRDCTIEIVNYHKKGEPYWTRLTLSPVRNRWGEISHFYSVQYSTTDEHQGFTAIMA
jgi:methyl-accepting chemotaxis protein